MRTALAAARVLARHDCLVIADSDVRVGPDYLQRVIAPLLDEGVGIVTCLYHGSPRPGLWSLLGAMFINEWLMASVRIAGCRATVTMLLITIAARFMIDSRPRRAWPVFAQLWLVALNDLLRFSLWCWGYATRQVRWRQARYHVGRDGTARPIL